MSTASLSTVAINVVEQYNLAGKSLVQAYRAGSQRVLRSIDGGYAELNSRLPLVNEDIKAKLVDAQSRIAGVVTGGVTQISDRTAEVIDRLAQGATGGIERLAKTPAPFGATVPAPALEALRAIQQPAAELSLKIATQVAEISKRVLDTVSASNDAPATSKPAPKRAARKA